MSVSNGQLSVSNLLNTRNNKVFSFGQIACSLLTFNMFTHRNCILSESPRSTVFFNVIAFHLAIKAKPVNDGKLPRNSFKCAL